MSLEDGKVEGEVEDDTPEEDVSMEWVEEQEDEEDSESYTTEKEKHCNKLDFLYVCAHIILEEELEKAEGICKTSMICAPSSRLAVVFSLQKKGASLD